MTDKRPTIPNGIRTRNTGRGFVTRRTETRPEIRTNSTGKASGTRNIGNRPSTQPTRSRTKANEKVSGARKAGNPPSSQPDRIRLNNTGNNPVPAPGAQNRFRPKRRDLKVARNTCEARKVNNRQIIQPRVRKVEKRPSTQPGRIRSKSTEKISISRKIGKRTTISQPGRIRPVNIDVKVARQICEA